MMNNAKNVAVVWTIVSVTKNNFFLPKYNAVIGLE